MTWPGGWGTPLRLSGRARDIVTPLDGGAPVVLSEATVVVGIGAEREIRSIEATPMRPGIAHLVGYRGGGNLRQALVDHVPDERRDGTPLYLLLDDVAGATLIATFAWSRWGDEWRNDAEGRPRSRKMIGVCAGFRPGSGSLDADGNSNMALAHNVAPVDSLVHADDPLGWHELPELPPVAMRRARRIDVTVGDVIEIDAMFRDSAGVPDGGHVAVHEYHLTATADRGTGELLTIVAEPRVLPYRECPAAAANVTRLVGSPLSELRSIVLEQLRTTDSCTHLNDAMRALAEVPVLADAAVRATTERSP